MIGELEPDVEFTFAVTVKDRGDSPNGKNHVNFLTGGFDTWIQLLSALLCKAAQNCNIQYIGWADKVCSFTKNLWSSGSPNYYYWHIYPPITRKRCTSSLRSCRPSVYHTNMGEFR